MDYKLRIQAIRDKQDVLTFPCDESGCVDMDAMDAATRNRYLLHGRWSVSNMRWRVSHNPVLTSLTIDETRPNVVLPRPAWHRPRRQRFSL